MCRIIIKAYLYNSSPHTFRSASRKKPQSTVIFHCYCRNNSSYVETLNLITTFVFFFIACYFFILLFVELNFVSFELSIKKCFYCIMTTTENSIHRRNVDLVYQSFEEKFLGKYLQLYFQRSIPVHAFCH